MSVNHTAARPRAAAPPGGPWPILGPAAVAGLLGGALTFLGQRPLSGTGWFLLVNSASPWAMVAFSAGARVPGRWRTAAVAGATAEAGLVAGYYASAAVAGFAVDTASVVVWVVTGLVAGPVYGAAGASWRHPRLLPRASAVGVSGAVWLADGVTALRLATGGDGGPGTAAGWCAVAAGVALPLLLGRSARDRLLGLVVSAVAAAAVLGAEQAVDWTFLHLA
ncbi:DUF6518 family protein [Microbispora sp. ATCC PTA-5024]|uniref:DUF6518 family protein n=1 Tax=Microbispora sp. ATCC PTA-5024 TaxID=316330 RepID=UPI0003DC83FB|nr:DUF6518 family protein [Microbispora sp. ATCC PTA-5024]ETK35119.1 hypothetical protein MPTA5024_15910 [Microbispora sp. ATCC PTA-5024]